MLGDSVYTFACVLCVNRSVLSDSLWPHGLSPARFLCPQSSPGKNAREGGHSLLQGGLPDPGIEPVSLTSPALAGGFFITSAAGEAHLLYTRHCIWCLISKYLHNISQKSGSYLHFQNKQRGYLPKVTDEKQQTSVWFWIWSPSSFQYSTIFSP